jgi:pantoate--beta-alanine ligase
MYGKDAKTVISVKNLSNLHCGVARPGHFDGVATVVCKLFNMVQPDLGYFGQKDFQQLVIISAMVRDLNIPVEIRSTQTVRESSGLAMSSRNGYLSPGELRIAPQLYQALCTARDEILSGDKPYETIENEAKSSLKQVGFMPEYVSVSKPGNLLKANKQDTDFVILAAASLGRTRLIDNVCFSVAR